MYKSALEILSLLNNEGYEAYIIGGYVRDKLIGIENSDIDIITSATPDRICNIFNNDYINNYGSINLKYNDYNFDITTFRKEFNYQNRKPNIEFITSLKEDLKRRDFTINTICIDKNGNYIDLLNGISDLNNKLLKCVGNPVDKLNEDPLRILRAIRFSSIYNFKLDEELEKEIILNKSLINTLSFDRIRKELDYIFNSNNVNLAIDMFNRFNLFELLNIKPKNSVIETGNKISIWAQLEYTDKYNFSNEEKKSINEIKEIIIENKIDNYTVYKYNMDNIKEANKILNLNIDIDDIYNNLSIYNKKDIDISFEDLKDIVDINNINQIYIDLEKQILYNRLKNKKEDIISYITSNKVGDNNE